MTTIADLQARYQRVVSGTFSGTGQSAAACFNPGKFNISLSGGVGTVKLEKSYDEGTTWLDDSLDALGTLAAWNLNGNEMNVLGEECERGVLYRFNCTSYSSGTLTYRLSQ